MNAQKIEVDKTTGFEVLITYDKTGREKTRYCLEIDPAKWQPKHPSDICPEYMLRFCEKKGLADLQWYVDLLDEKVKNSKEKTKGDITKTETVERKRTPSEVRQKFVEKYFPDMKLVKEEKYAGHAAKAKAALAELLKGQGGSATPKKSGAPKE